MTLYTDEQRIGILGMQRSGKSTFITSLIHHLEQQADNPGRFPLGTGGRAVKFRYLPPADDDTPEFPYHDFRDRLEKGRWPQKTRALSEYRCELDLTGGGRGVLQFLNRSLSKTRLTLTDIPGEWLADLTMAGADYPAWADRVYDVLEGTYLDTARDYLRLVEANQPLDASAVVTAYKQTMARLVFEYMPMISPSTLVLTPDGQYIPKDIIVGRDADQLAATRFVGLDAARQFAPLPSEARERNPAVADEFARHYLAYRDQLVTPLAKKYAACDQLVILIDPAVLLAAGVNAYKSCVDMLALALAYAAPGQNTWQLVGQWLAASVPWLNLRLPFTPQVRKIAVVASQADKVHAKDRDALGDLVRKMVAPLFQRVEATKWLKVKYFTCSAVESSTSLEHPTLAVRPMDDRGRPEDELRKVTVSPVPYPWPQTWQAGEFTFPTFAPWRPPGLSQPPPHIGLNTVAEFLLDL